jgi:hypothetical protein
MKKHLSSVWLGISVALYLSCLPLEVFGGTPGFSVLLLGWLGVLYSHANPANLSWLANPFIFISWIFLAVRNRRGALICSSLALLSSCLFLFPGGVVVNESGTPSGTSIGIGYWLWLMSIICACAASSLIRADLKTAEPLPEMPGEPGRFDNLVSVLSHPVKTGSLSNQRVKTLDDAVLMYRDRDLNSPTFPPPPVGTELLLGSSSMLDGREWLEVTLPDGVQGYALGPNLRGHTA